MPRIITRSLWLKFRLPNWTDIPLPFVPLHKAERAIPDDSRTMLWFPEKFKGSWRRSIRRTNHRRIRLLNSWLKEDSDANVSLFFLKFQLDNFRKEDFLKVMN